MGWMTEMKQELSRKWLPFKLCEGTQYSSAEHWCVCVCVFICFTQVQNTLRGNHTPTCIHTHTNLPTQTYPSSTAATQQMWRAGFNFLAPRLSTSLMYFSSPPSCSHSATAAAQWYWLAIKPSNCYKEVNILKLLRFFTLLTLMCTLYYSFKGF